MFRALAACSKARPSRPILPPSSGPLVEKNIPPEWTRTPEEPTLDPLVIQPKKASSPIVPDSVSGWIKVMDRDAGDDETDFVRIGSKAVVPDTKLTKYQICETGRFHSVKTASPDSMIEILNHMQHSSPNIVVVKEIVSRIEYLSSTLSVKKIRLLLEALASVPGIAAKIDPQIIQTMVRAVGNEILCRFHALTLNSCASILKSLATLKCVEPGTLNILAIGFEKMSNGSTLEGRRIVEHAITIMRAYRDLNYSVQAVTETGLTVLGDRVKDISRDDFFKVIEIIGLDHEVVSKHGWVVHALSKRIHEATAAQLIKCVEICDVETSELVTEILRKNLVSRIKVRTGSVVLLDQESEDEDGLPVRAFRELNQDQIQMMRNRLGGEDSLLDQLVSTVSQ